MAFDNEYANTDARQANKVEPVGSFSGVEPAEYSSAPTSTRPEASQAGAVPTGHGAADPIQALADETRQASGGQSSTSTGATPAPTEALPAASAPPASAEPTESGLEPASADSGADGRSAAFSANPYADSGESVSPAAAAPSAPGQAAGSGYGIQPSPAPAEAQSPTPGTSTQGDLNGSASYLDRHQIYQDGQSTDTLYQIVDQGNGTPILQPIAASGTPSNAGEVVSTSYSDLTVLSQPAYSNATYAPVADSKATGQTVDSYNTAPYSGYGPYSAGGTSTSGTGRSGSDYPSQGNGGVISPAPAGDASQDTSATPSASQTNASQVPTATKTLPPQSTADSTSGSSNPETDLQSLLAQNTFNPTTDTPASNTGSAISGDNGGLDHPIIGSDLTTGQTPGTTPITPSSTTSNTGDNSALVSDIQNQLVDAIAGYAAKAVESYLASAVSSALPGFGLLAAAVPGK